MEEGRSIIHFNVAGFASKVEQVVDVSLRQRPVIVAPYGAARALVWDMNEEAFQEGIRKGMPLRVACRRCRAARVVEPHTALYERAMEAMFRQAAPFSPCIERGRANGHLFLDMTGTRRLFGPPDEVAWRVRRATRMELGLDPVWTVAGNKLVAKVASRLVKPSGANVVDLGDESAFFAPLPISLLPGLHRIEKLKLEELNLVHMGEVAALSPAQLAVVFGGRARFLHDCVQGRDETPVQANGVHARLSFSHVFVNGSNEQHKVKGALRSLVEQTCFALRQRNLAATRFGLALTYSDGVRISRRITAKRPISDDPKLFEMASIMLDRAWQRRVCLRRLGLCCERFFRPKQQLSLFSAAREEDKQQSALLTAMDTIRNRFGHNGINAASVIACSTNHAV